MVTRWLLLLLIATDSLAQPRLNPRYQAMGNAGVALQGLYNVVANPAGLANLTHATVGLAYLRHAYMADLTSHLAMAGFPCRLGTFGIAADRYGLRGTYRSLVVGFSFVRSFGPQLSLGLTTRYHQLWVPTYLQAAAVSVDAGVQYRMRDGTIVGLHAVNVGQATYGGRVYGTIPAGLGIGISQQLEQVTLTADGWYRPTQPVSGHFGLEYRLAAILCLRGGLSLQPLQQHAGFGLGWGGFDLDVGAVFHPQLGMSPQIGLSYAF